MPTPQPVPDSRLARWALLMVKHRWIVLAAWVAILGASMAVIPKLSDLLSNRFVLPHTEAEQVRTVLKDAYGESPDGTFVLVAKTDGQSEQLLQSLQQNASRLAATLPNGKVAGVQPVSEHVASARITTSLELADAKTKTEQLRKQVDPIPNAQVYLTGQPALEHDLDGVFAEDLKVGELFIAIPIALLILIFIFGTLSFTLPLLFAFVAIPTTLGIIYLVAHVMNLSSYIQNLVSLIGLGIAVDYSLLVVSRYREERRRQSKEHAIATTMSTAGRAVVFSGTAVGIGLALMLIMPLPFMQGFGVAGLIIPTVSILCALTLLPVMLYFLTDAFDKVRLIPKRVIESRQDDEHSFWGRLARTIMKRPFLFASATAIVLLLLAAPVLALKPGSGGYDANKLPKGIESVDGFQVLSDASGEGALSQGIVLVDAGRAGDISRTDIQAAIGRLDQRLAAEPEVGGVVSQQVPGLLEPSGQYQQIIVSTKHNSNDEGTLDLVKKLRNDIIPAAGFPDGTTVIVGGEPGGSVDFLRLTYEGFPYLIAGILFLTLILLARAFRSIVLPIKAIILNLLAIGAAYGVMVAVFQWGWGEHIGLIEAPIEGWVPVFMFAMLFGLSMDYEVFLVSRMREEWDRRQNNEKAVVFGLAKTGRLVTAAGLIMVAAFSGFVAGSLPGLQQFGFGLAIAILIDVTIIRGLLLPSAMKILGDQNWWLPEWAAKVLQVKT